MVHELVRPTLARGAAPDTAWAYFDGRFVPIREARISVMTHAFNYGTGVFEGLRAYWNPTDEQLYALHVREHFDRFLRSCRVMRISAGRSAEQLVELTLELVRRCAYREDCYIRPIAYKSSEVIGVRLHDLADGLTIFAIPFGEYIATDRGISCTISSWRRIDDNAIPARSKITGAYANAALAKTDAEEAGFDEGIVLTDDGHVSEGTAANLFMVRDGRLVTPPGSDNILEGIVRASVLRIASDEGIPVEIRRIDRTELYICDEVFLCGTGVQISSVTSIDHRPVGDGRIGPIATRLSRIYFDAVRGKVPRYRDWLTPVYSR